MLHSDSFWKQLFGGDQKPADGIEVPGRLLRKRGRPWLLLPLRRRAAARCLDLYPAQTTRARLVKRLLRMLLGLGLPAGTNSITFTIAARDEFGGFLRELTNTAGGSVPTFGVLAGNPASAGQRFMILLFDAEDRPVVVVKSALNEQAKALVRSETEFLTKAAGCGEGIPRLIRSFRSIRVEAFALDFFQGDSPPGSESALRLLASWVHPAKKVRLSETALWRRLESLVSKHPLFDRLAGTLAKRPVPATVYHGDFAPWNVKVDGSNKWTVLDWERGEMQGIPAWDWFHFLIQPAILVRHMPTTKLVNLVHESLKTPAFKAYAAHAEILGVEPELVIAYLLNVVESIKPSEGLTANQELLSALCG